MRNALRAFGEDAYYGVRSVELIRAPAGDDVLSFGSLIGPGRIVLYDQPRSPWYLSRPLRLDDRESMRSAGAEVGDHRVSWPPGTLRTFMLAHVLAHEVGHHVLQHERRLRGERAARTRDHERRAEAIARGLRARLA